MAEKQDFSCHATQTGCARQAGANDSILYHPMIFHKFTQIAAVLLGLAIPFTGMAQEKVAPTKPETTKMKDIRIVMKRL